MNTCKRRDFMRGSLMTIGAISASAAGGAGVPASAGERLPAAKASGLPNMNLSVLSYSFRGLLEAGKIDIFGYLETCKYRYHLSIADIWNGFLPSMEESFLRKVREALDERELTLTDYCADQVNIWENDPAKREKFHQNALANLNAARILGAKFMRVDAGGNGTAWTDEQFDLIVKRYKEYAQYAYDHGFKAGSENHWGPETVWANMQKLFQAVNHPGFGVCCHMRGWHGTLEEKDEADRLVAPWVCHTHFPWHITEGPLEEKMRNLRDVGYQGAYSVEHHTGKNEYAEVAVQLARVRAVFDRWRNEGLKG